MLPLLLSKYVPMPPREPQPTPARLILVPILFSFQSRPPQASLPVLRLALLVLLLELLQLLLLEHIFHVRHDSGLFEAQQLEARLQALQLSPVSSLFRSEESWLLSGQRPEAMACDIDEGSGCKERPCTSAAPT